jgi:hypothetical protein
MGSDSRCGIRREYRDCGGDGPSGDTACRGRDLSIGGIGIDQARAIKDVMHSYSMVLTFVGKTSNQNQYLSDVPVTITDGKGNTVLETSSDGPFMLVSLPSGHYTVNVSYKGQAEHRTMNISNDARARQTFVWAM